MKKMYLKPEIENSEIKNEVSFLAGSGPTGATTGGQAGENDGPDAKFGSTSIWGDDE